MCMSILPSRIDDLNKYLRGEADDDVVLSSLDALLNMVAGENDEKKIEILLPVVFNKTNGLLQFLKSLKKLPHVNRNIVEKSFEFLKNLLSGFVNTTSCYISEIFDICKTNSSWAESTIVKHKSYELLSFIIENTSTSSYFLENPQALRNFFEETISKTESTKGHTELKDVYVLIGSIIDSYREIVTDKNKKRLLRKLTSELNDQLVKENITVLEGCYECLLVFLKQFAEELSLLGDKSVYTLVKKGCELNKRCKTSVRAAFRVIGQCISLFGDHVYNEYEFWYLALLDYLSSSNKEDYIVALNVLDVFYLNMAKLLGEKKDAKSKLVLKFFLEKLKNDLSNPEDHKRTSAMKNFGHFATTCRKFGIDNEVENMFNVMAGIADKYYSSAEEENMELFHLSDLLISLTVIISSKSSEVDDFDENKLNILARITVHVIVSYPKVETPFRNNVRRSVIEAVIRLGLFNATVFNLYLEKFIYLSLIQSCSALMKSEVELLESNRDFSEEVVSASDYNLVWKDLCNITQVKFLGPELDDKIPEFRRQGLHTKIFDNFISAVLKIINKLDFSLMEDNLQEPSNCIIPIYEGSKPRTENDYYIFANLVQLFSHVVAAVDFDVLKPWISKLTATFIDSAMKCPIKSGFFELLSLVLKKCKIENDWNEEMRNLKSFLLQILSQVPEFKGPDLISCLHIMMNVPQSFIEDILPYMTALFQNVFTLGLQNISLAREGLNTLNEWYFLLSSGQFDMILSTLIPHLHSYLDSKGFEGDTDAITKYEEKLLMPVITQRKNKLYRKFFKVYVDATCTEEYKLRRDIIRFLGKVDTELCSSMYSIEDFTLREMTDVLKFDLPYVDMKVRIYLDRCLPRIMELARNSSDTRTRIVACEVLHSITTIFIGNIAHDLQSLNPKGAEVLSKNLLVCIFKLGSDLNGVICQLYRPLCFQLTHYFSNNANERQNFVSNVLLEILFNGVSNEDDTLYKQFCGELIREFVDWSIKQSKHVQYDMQVNSNVIAVMKWIYLFCMLPCSKKRLGAAIAFNNIYRKLREEQLIIQNYWIEILYYFVRSLNSSGDNDCNNKQMSIALDHVKRVLYERFDLFLESCRRPLPKELKGGTLTDVVNWLFTFCTSRNRYCRIKCVSFVEDLASRLEYGSFENYFDIVGRRKITETLELLSRSLEMEFHSGSLNSEDLFKIMNWMEDLLSGLYCVNWLVTKKVVNVDYLFASEANFVDTMKFFVKNILPLTKNNFRFLTADKSENFIKMISSFELIQQDVFLIVLHILVNSSKENFALFASEDILWDKFILLLFEPSQFFVDVMANENWNKIVTLILEYISTLPDSTSNPIFMKIDNFIRENTFLKCSNDISKMSFSQSQNQQYLDALNVLQATNVLSKIIKDIDLLKEEIIRHIFASLSCNDIAVSPNSKVSSFLENVLYFCLKNAEITFIIEFVFNSAELKDEKKNTSIFYGRHFFCTFRKSLVEYLSYHQAPLISYCLQEPALITSMKIRTLIDCVVEMQESKKTKLDTIIYEIYANWKILITWSQGFDTRISLLFELIKKTIAYYYQLEKYDRSSVTVVFQWLLTQLTCVENSLITKKRIVSLLSSFLVKKLTDDEDQMLRGSLNLLQQQHFVQSTEAISSNDQWNVILFNALLITLAESRCILILEFMIRIRCSQRSTNSCDDRIPEVLEKLCKSTSDEQLTLLLFIYEICQQKSQDIEFRVNCIQIFLMPMLCASLKDSVHRFFRSKLAHIWNTFETPLRPASSDEKTNLNNWTVAVMLIDAYSKVIADFDSPELTNVVFPNNNKSCIRKEFFKQLHNIVIRKVNVMNRDNVSCVRKLQCCAYNALIKVIRRVHQEEKFYKLVFMENPSRDMFVWERIVDCNVRIELRMVPDQISARKKKIKQQKRKIKSNHSKNTHLLIPTQYLATSSLVDDVTRHDMSEWNIGNGLEHNGNIILNDTSIDLEEDELNNHECMASLCELINFIFESGISREPKTKEEIVPAMPEWMECIRESFKWYLRKPDHKNIIVFILKLIYNSDRFFRPFAAHWVDLIVDSLCVIQELNYFVMEIVVMLLDWNTIAALKNQDSKNRFLHFVITKMDEEEYAAPIQNYLFDLIETMIMTWHEGLRAPPFLLVYASGISEFSEKKLELGLKICKQFLSMEIVPFDDKTRFIPSLLHHSLMKKLRRSNTLLMFEVTGLTLRVLKDKPDILSIKEHSSLHERLVDCLNKMNAENIKTKTDLFFSCLLRTVSYYPTILQSFASYLLNSFGRFQGEIKIKCLKILNVDISQLPDNAFTVLMQQNFACCIRDSDNYELRRNALKTIKLCLEKIQEQDLQQLMSDIWRLSMDVTSECRGYVYDIADYIYERNKDETYGEQFEMKIKCKAILLNGLLDNDTALQQKLFSSWVKRLNLDSKISVRFEQIMDKLYSPLNESQFVCNAANFLLESCRSTPDYESPIFDNPLFGGYQFQKYEVNLSYRSVASHTPLFGSSFTNKFLTFSQSLDFGSSSVYLRETQDNLMFQPTLDSQMETDAEFDASFKQFQSKTEYPPSGVASETNSAIKRLKRPLYESSIKASIRHAGINIKKQDKREELLKEKADKQKTVNLCRRYRYGDMPDIEISRSALINPLRVLAKRDPIIGKLVFMSILEGILKNVDRKIYLNSLNSNLKKLCKASPLRDTIFVETLFEIAFNYSQDVHFDTQQILTASYASGLHSFGALLLEESISSFQNVDCDMHRSKKQKTDSSCQDTTWTQLAELYKALDQTDIVNGILKEKLMDTICSKLKQGLEFEQNGNKIDALKKYSELIDETSSRLGRCYSEHFVLEAYSNCAAYLSQWHELNNQITKKFRDVNDLWNDNWNVETTLPWFLTSEAYTCMYETCILGLHDRRTVSSPHMEAINTWLEDEDRNLVLMNLIPESIVSLLVLANKQTEALIFINKCVKLILDDWRHWKSTENRFSQVQTLSEFEAFLSNPTHETKVTTMKKMDEVIEVWRRNTSKLSNSMWWDRRIIQKLFFKKKFTELVVTANEENSFETLQRLDLFEIETILSFIENALDHENITAACKYLRLYEKIDNNEEKKREDITARYDLDLSRLFLLQGIKSCPRDRKMDFQRCLEQLHGNRIEIIKWYPYEYHTHVAHVSSAIIENEELMTSDRTYWSTFTEFIHIVVFERTCVSVDSVVSELRNAILSNYEKAASASLGQKNIENVSKACLKAAQFCRRFIDEDKENETYQICLVQTILKAMKFESKEGQMLFPILLQLSRITSDNLKREFLNQTADVEEWKFLPWISQLLAYVGVDNMLPVIEDIIIKTARKYPTVVYYPYLLYKEKFCSNLHVESFAIKLKNILETNPGNTETSKFIKELAFVRPPVLYFAHWWQELKKASRDELFEVATKIDAEITHELPTKGKLFHNDILLNALKNCLNLIKSEQDVQKAIDSFGETVNRQRNIGRQPQKEWLKNFNPWLVDSFTEQCSLGVEIPGQYDQYNGCTRPDPERHVKIYEFGRKVEVQNSKQQPIKMELIGTDGNRYAYLIKFEEDMRQDQRIQQIFAILNRCSRDSNSTPTKRKLSAATYCVFPLNKHFAMIEWVNNTATLKDFMDFGCSDEEKEANEKTRLSLQNEYLENLRKRYFPTGILSDFIQIYEESMKRLDEMTTVASFRTLSSRIPEDVFRKSLLSLCHASNEFWQLRNQFMLSYSTVCVYGWILGIGDRHLKNTLVSLKTGNCIGIDFGVAFGTGIENLRIPELIPFRMTPHIKAIMAPFFLTGLIRETMINILQVIQENEYVLFGTLQIFILDPSLNWINSARNRMPHLKPDITTNEADTRFCPKQINIVKRKLRGGHPMKILQDELKNNVFISDEHRKACHQLIEKLRLGTTLSDDCLTAVQQVACLLDLATNECILGTSWHGLETYI